MNLTKIQAQCKEIERKAAQAAHDFELGASEWEAFVPEEYTELAATLHRIQSVTQTVEGEYKAHIAQFRPSTTADLEANDALVARIIPALTAPDLERLKQLCEELQIKTE